MDDIVRKLGLNQAQRELLHREIHGQNYSYQEALKAAMDMFGEERRKQGGGGFGFMGTKPLEE